jgi:hypothetical protein
MPDSVGSVATLSIDPNGRRYLTTRAGVYLSQNSFEWVDVSTGPPKQNRWVKALAVGPRGERLYAGLHRTDVGADEHGLYVRDLTTAEETPQ